MRPSTAIFTAVELKHAVACRLAGVTVMLLPLDRIIASKSALKREKDRAVLPALLSAARALKMAQGKPPRKAAGKAVGSTGLT